MVPRLIVFGAVDGRLEGIGRFDVFEVDEFIDQCRMAADEGVFAVRDLLVRTMTQRSDIEVAFDTPTKASLDILYASSELTILNAVWAPTMSFPPHDHRTWAVIGIYGGEEQNTFYRRASSTIEQTAGRNVKAGEIIVLDDEVIHAVRNPLQHSFTGGIHIYGGDYLNKARSIWDADNLGEGPATFEQSQGIFARANQSIRPEAPD